MIENEDVLNTLVVTLLQHHEHTDVEDSYRKWLEVSLRQNYTKLKDLLVTLSRDVEKYDCEMFE